MKRIMGITGIVLAGVLAGCGNPLSANKPPAPTPQPAATQTQAPSPEPTPSPSATPSSSPTPDLTTSPSPSATPTPAASATPATTATPGGAGGSAGQVNLPDQVDTFMKVEGRSDGEIRIGAYYSDKLKTVTEARTTSGKSAKDFLATQGVTDPAAVGKAWCGGNRDNLCAQDKGGVVVLLSSKELPGSMLADLTTQFLAAMGKN